MVNINLNISNKTFYLLIGIFVILAVSGIAIAYNSGVEPSVMGHTADEIEGAVGGGYWVPSDIKTTDDMHNGDFGGYKEMNDWIQNNGCSGYHVCDNIEIVRYISKTGIKPSEGWYIGGQREQARQWGANGDCDSWTRNSGRHGEYWDGNFFEGSGCSDTRAVLCCK